MVPSVNVTSSGIVKAVLVVSLCVTLFGCQMRYNRQHLAGVTFSFNGGDSSVKERPQPICTGQLHLEAPKRAQAFRRVSTRLYFEGETYPIETLVSNSLYRTAITTGVDGCEYDFDPLISYYQTLASQAALHPFYSAQLAPLRNIRAEHGMDDSTYARLIVRYVQNMEGCEQKTYQPKSPVTMVVDNCGDCDEKSALMAGLLSTEGYDVVLFVFDRHAAVGIASDDSGGLNDTDYLYIESTIVSRIGWKDPPFESAFIVDPIPIGTGKKRYQKSTMEKLLDERYEQVRNWIEVYGKDIDDVHVFDGRRLDLKTVDSAKQSLDRAFFGLSPAERGYLVCAAILEYINRTPHSLVVALTWVDKMVNWLSVVNVVTD